MFLKENILPRCFPRIPVPSWTHPHDPVRCEGSIVGVYFLILPRCFPRIPVPSWTHPHDPVRCAKCCNDCVVLLTVVYAGKLCYVRNRCEKMVDNERKN